MAAHQAPDDDFQSWGKLPKVVAPNDAESFDRLIREVDSLMDELVVKSEIIAATIRGAISNPKPGSKYADAIAPLRFDLKAKGWWIARPWAGVAAGAEAIQRSARESRHRYYSLIESTRTAARARKQTWG